MSLVGNRRPGLAGRLFSLLLALLLLLPPLGRRAFANLPTCAGNCGICPTCTDRGVMDAKLIAQRNPRTLKRFIRCEHYDICETSYPLPQYGELTPTEDVCEACGAPMVIIKTARGPWKLCPNFDCPSKEEEKAAKKKPRRKGKSTRKKKQ